MKTDRKMISILVGLLTTGLFSCNPGFTQFRMAIINDSKDVLNDSLIVNATISNNSIDLTRDVKIWNDTASSIYYEMNNSNEYGGNTILVNTFLIYKSDTVEIATDSLYIQSKMINTYSVTISQQNSTPRTKYIKKYGLNTKGINSSDTIFIEEDEMPTNH